MQERGLGRGLSAFFENTSDQINGNVCGESVVEIDITEIRENPFQPRKIFDDAAISSLAESIKEHGILQPLLVQRDSDGNFTLIAGERRLRAARCAHIKKVPCIVKTGFTKDKLLEVAILENIQREDLNVIEEAESYKRLIEEFNLTQERISETTGKSRSHIANMLRLNTLPAAIKTMVHDKKISFGHARALVGIPNAEELAKKIVECDLSVRQTEKLVKDSKFQQAKDTNAIYEERSESEEIRSHIARILNLSVAVKLKRQGGTIELRFKNSSELDRFMQLISKNEQKGGIL